MASPYSRSFRDGPDNRNKPRGLGETRREPSPLGATRHDDFGFDWLDHTNEPKRDYKWESSRQEDYRQSRVVGWNGVGDTMRDDTETLRPPNGRYMRGDAFGVNAKRVDLGVTGQTRREEYEWAAESRRSPDENPYILNHLDRPGATRRVPLSETSDGIGSRVTPTPGGRPDTRVHDMREAHSVEPSLPDYDYVYNRQHENGNPRIQNSKNYLERSWTSMAADQNLMSEWHDMFSKIRTKWNGQSGFDNPSSVTGETISYSRKRHSGLSGTCKIVILAILVLILLAMAAVITYVMLVGPDTEPEVTGVYDISATISNMNYTEDMNDTNSEAFQTIAKDFCAEVDSHVSNSSPTSGIGYERCVVNELQNGSVIVLFSLVVNIPNVNKAPTNTTILQFLGLNMAPGTSNTFGSFVISVAVVIQTFRPLGNGVEVPATEMVAFNDTCGSKKKRQICETKRSKCKNKICTCSANRIYVADEDSCNKIKCIDIAEIHNGTITTTGSEYGDILEVQCVDGFEWPSDTVIECLTPTSWTDIPDCTPVVCEDFVVPDNAVVVDGTISGLVFQDTINIVCNPGYIAEGTDSVRCQANMTWSTPPVCTMIECDEITDVSHGTTTNQTGNITAGGGQVIFPLNSTVDIECDTGYELDGDTATLQCMENGSWSPNVSCIPIQCIEYIPPDDTVSVVDTTGPNYPFGSNLTLNCKPGLSFADGSLSSELTCNSSGSWSGEQSCDILGSVSFDEEDYILNKGDDGTLFCHVSNFSSAQTVTIFKFDIAGPSVPLYMIHGADSEGVVSPGVTWVQFNHSIQDNELLVQMSFAPVDVDHCGIYTCRVAVNENDVVLDEKMSNASVEVIGYDNPSMEVNEVETVIVECTGFTDEAMLNDELYLETKYQGDDSFTEVINSTTEQSNISGCQYVTSKSYTLPTVNKETNISVRCATNINGSISTSPEINITLSPLPCDEEFLNPENSIVLANDSFSITLDCEKGYRIQGNETVICNDGNWSESPICEEIECGVVDNTSISNGSLIDSSGTKYSDYAVFACDEGFTLIGIDNITCLDDGLWETFPECVQTDCGDLTPPPNSNVINNLTIVCDLGYELNGNASIVCKSNGNWSDLGKCLPIQCGQFPTPDNAVSDATPDYEYVYQDEVNVTCIVGHESESDGVAVCNASSVWANVPVCDPIACQGFVAPMFSVFPDGPESYVYGDEFNITCEDGYELDNAAQVSCNATGEWGTLPECIPIVCEDLVLPAHARTDVLTGIEFGQKINISCDIGFEIDNAAPVSCNATGEWGTLPECTPIVCEDIVLPANATTDVLTGIEFGQEINISCDVGFEIDNTAPVSCNATGEWGTLPECTPIICDDLVLPANATTDVLTGIEFGQEINVSCDVGFEISDNSTIQCTSNGEWNNLPSCLATDCDTSTLQNNSFVSGDGSDSAYPFGSSVDVECDEGYMLLGDISTTECTENRTWNPIVMCRPVICDEYMPYDDTIKNGNYNNTNNEYGSTLTIDCKNGLFFPDGSISTNLTCNATGMWSGQQMCAIQVECIDIAQIHNGNITTTGSVYGSSLHVQCDEGFEWDSDTDIECLLPTSWTDIPDCTHVVCEDFVVPDNAAVVDGITSGLVFQETINVVCNSGYIAEGPDTVRCQANMTWSTPPVCTMIECHEITDVSHGTTTNPTGTLIAGGSQEIFPLNSTVDIECDTGYELDGDTATLQCMETGSWSPNVSCIPIQCIEYIPPDDTVSVVDTTGPNYPFGSNLTLNCKPGLSFADGSLSSELTCNSSGSWSGEQSCDILGSVSFDEEDYILNKGDDDTLVCHVSNFSSAQTVTIIKFDIAGPSVPFYMIHGADSEGVVSPGVTWVQFNHSIQDDELSVQMSFAPVDVDHCGIYTCRVAVNEGDNVLDEKLSNTSVEVIGYDNPSIEVNEGEAVTVECTGFTDEAMLDDELYLETKYQGDDSFTEVIDSTPMQSNISGCKYVTSKSYTLPNVNKETNISVRCATNLNGITSTSPEINITLSPLPCDEEFLNPENSIVLANDSFSITLDCERGYRIEGNGTVICNDGNWTESPICKEIECIVVDNTSISNGSLIDSSGTKYSDFAVFACDEGFTLIGNDNITCLEDGLWETFPECVQTDCGDLTPPPNSNVINNLTIVCDLGYELDGNASIVCQSNGNWSDFGKCLPVQCGQFPTPDNAVSDIPDYEYVYQDEVNVTCIVGHESESDGVAVCNASGVWANVPVCDPIACQDFVAPMFSVFPDGTESYVYGDEFNITCEDGYELDNAAPVSCNATGEWGTLPECRPIVCEDLVLPANATTDVLTGIEFGQEINISCDVGFEISDNSTIQCTTNGEWNNLPSCFATDCDTSTLQNNSFVSGDGSDSAYPFGSSVDVECDEGYMIFGDISTTECTENRTWHPIVMCRPVICDEYMPYDDKIKNGNYNNTDNEYGSTLTIDCKDGLSFPDGSISTNLTCNATGMWSGQQMCAIQGDVVWESDQYSLQKGEDGILMCNVTNYMYTQTLRIVKLDETTQSLTTLNIISNVSGDINNNTLESGYEFSYTVDGSDISVQMKVLSVGTESCGSYACGLLAIDADDYILESKVAMTNVTVTDIREPVITVSADSIEVGEEVEVQCEGYIDKDMSEEELYLEIKPESNNSYTRISPSSSVYEVVNCQHVTTKSYTLSSEDLTEPVLVRCGIDNNEETLYSEDTPINVTLGAYAKFENDSYLLYVGETEVIVCDFYGEDVSFVVVYDSNMTNHVNLSADGTEVTGAFTIDLTGTFFQDTHTRLAVNVDLQNWCTNGGEIGNDTYTCEISYKNGNTRSTNTSVEVRKSAGIPELTRSVEIVEGKDSTLEKLFWCEGELGNPAGSMEIELDRTGEYERFLALPDGLNNTADGWIVEVYNVETECGVFQSIGFALRAVTMSMHLTNMRCVIKSPDGISKTQVSQSHVLKVVEASYCTGSTSFEYIAHPYYCHSAVACYADGTIQGVPEKCPSDDQCFDTRVGSSSSCDISCEEVGCVYQPIVCDQTESWSHEGSDVEFNCNLLDIEEAVTTISTNDEQYNVDELPVNQQVIAENVNATVTESTVRLSVVNVSCDNDLEYAVTVNDQWTKQLTLRVETDPDTPTIMIPEVLNANEEMVIVCSGPVGRDGTNSPKAMIHLAVADTNDISNGVVYETEDLTRESVVEGCTIEETVTYTIIPGMDWNGTYVACLTLIESTVFDNSTIEPIILSVPDVFCNPVFATTSLEGSVSYTCDLQDVANITNIEITKKTNEDAVIETVVSESVDSLPWSYSMDFEIDIPDTEGFTLNFANISCEDEGEYTVGINEDGTSAVVSLAIVSPPSVPVLYVQSGTRVNQLLEINCTANLGRDDKGDQLSDLYIEVKFEHGDDFIVYSDNVESSVNSDNCKHTGVNAVTFYPDQTWNNSVIRCVTKSGNTTYNVSTEETLTMEPSAIYFKEASGVGIIGMNYTMTCIIEGMVGLTDIVITHDEDPADIKNTEGVYIVENEINEIIANLTILKTIQCGDDGVYYCKTIGTSDESQAETSLEVQWTSGNPILDLSVDIVDGAFPWADFETLCTAELGSNNASIFIQSNRNGTFENLSDTETSTYPIIDYDSSMCTNVKTIAFVNTYTADWNETIFRCVVQDADSTKMDAEVIYVVSESICDNVDMGTKLPNPFDCRGEFTCSDNEKRLQPYKLCQGLEECYDYDIPACVDCKDVGMCREDPLDIEPYLDCTAAVGTIDESASILCTAHHITVDDTSSNVTLIRDGETIIATQSPTGTGPIDGDTTTPNLVLQPTTISADFDPVSCIDKGEYIVRVNNGTVEIEATAQLDVERTASEPTISTSLEKYYRGVEITIRCSGPIGKPEGSLELTVKSTPDGNFETVSDNKAVSYDAGNCTYVGELSHSFVVSDADEGFEYMCQAVGHDNQSFVSNIETVNVVDADIHFLDEQVVVPLGEQFEVVCMIASDAGISDAAITVTLSNGTTNDVCEVTNPPSNDTVTCQDGYDAIVLEDQLEWSVVVSGTAACHHEGNLHCFSPSNSQIQAVSQLAITRQIGNASLTVPITFEGKAIPPGALTCTADIGYPSAGRILKMETRATSDTNFTVYAEGESSGECEVEETIATKSNFAFQLSENGTEFKCVVYEGDTVLEESNIETLSVFANECPTDRDEEIFLPHPLYATHYVWCYQSGTLDVQECAGGLCFNATAEACDAC